MDMMRRNVQSDGIIQRGIVGECLGRTPALGVKSPFFQNIVLGSQMLQDQIDRGKTQVQPLHQVILGHRAVIFINVPVYFILVAFFQINAVGHNRGSPL